MEGEGEGSADAEGDAGVSCSGADQERVSGGCSGRGNEKMGKNRWLRAKAKNWS